jgi:hypothetical protein
MQRDACKTSATSRYWGIYTTRIKGRKKDVHIITERLVGVSAGTAMCSQRHVYAASVISRQ